MINRGAKINKMPSINPVPAKSVEFTTSTKRVLEQHGYASTDIESFILELLTKQGGTSVSSELQELREKVEAISADTLMVNARMYGLGTASVDAIKLQNRVVQYSLIGNELSYDFSALVKDLPPDMKYLSARADVIDANTGKKLVSVKGKKNSIQVPNLPATATLFIEVRGPNGNLTLDKRVELTADVDKSAPLNVTDFTVSPDSQPIKQAVETLAAQVALLKQR